MKNIRPLIDFSDFDEIYRKYYDPKERKKRLLVKRREEIEEDKKSSFGLI